MNVFDCRKQNNISISYMASVLGISPAEYMQYEENPSTIPINVALGISRVTGVHYDDIFFGDNSN